VRRTWAPRGRTSTLVGFGRHRDKVSTVAAIVASPRGRRPRLRRRTDPRRHIDAAAVVAFLRDLLRRLRGRVIVARDGGSNHERPLIRGLLSRSPRLHLERLPGCAPDLNPVEMIWSYLKHGRPADFVPDHVDRLDRVVRGHLDVLAGQPALIRSLWKGSKLPFLDKDLTT